MGSSLASLEIEEILLHLQRVSGLMLRDLNFRNSRIAITALASLMQKAG